MKGNWRDYLPSRKPPYSAYELDQTVNRIERLTKLRDKALADERGIEMDRYTKDIEISQRLLHFMLEKVHNRHAKKA